MKQALDTRTKLLTKSPWPLMLELSIPAVLGMVVVGLYNMMDSIFVGQLVGDVQMGAVSVSYPFTLINAGSAAMLGVGSASVLSRAIGKRMKTPSKDHGQSDCYGSSAVGDLHSDRHDVYSSASVPGWCRRQYSELC